MSVYFDTITLALAVMALFGYSRWVVVKRGVVSTLGFLACVAYLIAQTGWTVAWLTGDEWGREFNNYIWFIFNTSVFGLLLLLLKRGRPNG